MSHSIIKALNAEDIVRMIMADNRLTETEALREFYTSQTAYNLSDDSTGLYGQSPAYIYGLYEEEKRKR